MHGAGRLSRAAENTRAWNGGAMEAFFGILIPFIGTTLGAACVLFMKRSLAGFATGVMAAAVWSLSIPAIEQSADLGSLSFVPVFVGFWAGVLFLLALDHAIPHLHEGAKSRSPFSAWTRRERLTAAAGSSKPHCLVFLFRKGPLAVSSGCASPTIRRPSGILWRGCPPAKAGTRRAAPIGRRRRPSPARTRPRDGGTRRWSADRCRSRP